MKLNCCHREFDMALVGPFIVLIVIAILKIGVSP